MEKLTKRIHSNSFPRLPLVASLIFFVFSISSCTGVSFLQKPGAGGVYHRVKQKETLSEIARAYNIDMQSLAEVNNITNPSQIEENSVIFIPGAQAIIDEIETAVRGKKKNMDGAAKKDENKEGKVGDKRNPSPQVPLDRQKVKPVSGDTFKKEAIGPSSGSEKTVSAGTDSVEMSGNKTKNKSAVQSPNGEKREDPHFNKNMFIWPLKGKVVSFFGKQPNGMSFNGIRVAAPAGTDVLSSGEGTVIHSEFLKYYGETIIIQHKNGYATVYAGLGVRNVSVNSHVKKGDRIGFIGRDAQKNEVPLYFEIRLKNKAVNPLSLLP